MAESYAVSAVIPARDSAEQLKLSLPALLDNDLENVEVLIIDDASTDSTRDVVASYQQAGIGEGARVRYVQLERHSGPAAARNAGMKAAKNPYLLFIDADVVVKEQTVTWIRESLDLYSHRSDVAGVLGAYAETTPWGDFLTNFKNLNVCFLYAKTDTLSPFLHTPIFCIEKRILEKVGGFDSRLRVAEDFHLGVVLGSQGYRFVIDRRIKGTHLKRYGLGAVLQEDWRRAHSLRSIELEPQQKRFALRAHRLHRLLSVVLPAPVILFAGLAVLEPVGGVIALLLLSIFYLCNLPFLMYSRALRGWGFAFKAAAFVFVEMLWVELALVGSVLADIRVIGWPRFKL